VHKGRANSSQAKGRVERVNRTLQDRLVKELRLAGISNIVSGNAFLPAFMERFNQRFAIAPASTHDLHRPMQITRTRLGDILCHREQRYVGAQLTFHYDRKQIILEQTEVAKGLAGHYVEIFDHFDKSLEVRWQGHVLPYRVFNKDQIRLSALEKQPCFVLEGVTSGVAIGVNRTDVLLSLFSQLQRTHSKVGSAGKFRVVREKILRKS
jgi:hypothetical protein